jgi:hypothetical protein
VRRQKTNLEDLLKFWNTAPGNNLTTDALHAAHVDGELHSNDTTAIATTLEYNGAHGGSFQRIIFEVLRTAPRSLLAMTSFPSAPSA